MDINEYTDHLYERQQIHRCIYNIDYSLFYHILKKPCCCLNKNKHEHAQACASQYDCEGSNCGFCTPLDELTDEELKKELANNLAFAVIGDGKDIKREEVNMNRVQKMNMIQKLNKEIEAVNNIQSFLQAVRKGKMSESDIRSIRIISDYGVDTDYEFPRHFNAIIRDAIYDKLVEVEQQLQQQLDKISLEE